MDPSSKHKLLLKSKLLSKVKKSKPKLIINPDVDEKIKSSDRKFLTESKKTTITTDIQDTQHAIPTASAKFAPAAAASGSNTDTTVVIQKSQHVKKKQLFNYTPDTTSELSTLSNIRDKEIIYICAYRVHTTSTKPFLEYCLHKDSKDVLSFPFLKHKKENNPSIEGKQFIQTIFRSDSDISFYIRNGENENYLFYEIKQPTYKPKFMLKKSQWWWTLITEIVNYKKCMQFNISDKTTDLFLNNPSLIYLTDDNSLPIEVPGVGFHGTYYNILHFIMAYGLRPSTILSMMGPYFYFGTFRKAVRYAGWTSNYSTREVDGKVIADDKGRYKRGGIARFAIFLGKTRAFLNHSSDRDDFTDIVKERIRKNPRDERWEKMILKLHDHNGIWAEDYNSAYIGRVKLSNGGLLMKNPEFITKDFSQNILLTAHELDQNTLKEKWDGNYERYNIK